MEESDAVPLCRQKEENKGENRKRKKIEILSFFLFVVVVVTCFLIMQCKAVIVVEGEERKQFYTFSKTVGEFLEEKDLEVSVYDKVIPGNNEKIRSGNFILIRRALPVTLIADGKVQEVWTYSLTVAEFLQEEGLHLGDEDMVFPALGELLSPWQTVKVIRIVREKQAETEPIPFSTVRITNPQLDQGIVRVINEGSEGIRENIIESVRQDGEEISGEIISSQVIKEPVKRVLEYGANRSFSRGGRTYEFDKVVKVSATAYCPGTPGSGCPVDDRGAAQCTGFNNDGYTYTGIKAVAGDGTFANPHIIAVDPAVIPLKSLVFIEGYGFARAEDTGSAIKGSSIDLLFDQHYDACMFGRKTLKVYLLSN